VSEQDKPKNIDRDKTVFNVQIEGMDLTPEQHKAVAQALVNAVKATLPSGSPQAAVSISKYQMFLSYDEKDK